MCACYTDWVGVSFLGVCVLAQCLCLYGIYNKDESLMGMAHIMFGVTITVGTFLGRKIINYILVILFGIALALTTFNHLFNASLLKKPLNIII